MNWLSLIFSAAHAQTADANDSSGSVPAQGNPPVIEVPPVPVPEAPDQAGGYVAPVVEVEPVIVEEAFSYDIYGSFLSGISEGAFFAAIFIPILAMLVFAYGTICWINRRFLTRPEGQESNQSRIIYNTGDLIHLPKAHAESENGIVVINLSSRTQTLEQPRMTLPMEGQLIAETSDGTQIELAPGEGQRVLHALATLAQTPIGAHVTIRALRTADGEELWRSPVAEQR